VFFALTLAFFLPPYERWGVTYSTQREERRQSSINANRRLSY
jgi:hypothetical protein